MSKSDLDAVARSPAHWKYGRGKDSPEMAFGRLVHCAILEPGCLDDRYYPAPDCRRGTKEWVKVEEQAEGRELVKREDFEAALNIRDAVMAHRSAGALLVDGEAECSAFARDPETGIILKCRPDYLRTDIRCLIDLKTARSADAESFAKSTASYRYHVQNAMYLDVINRASPVQFEYFFFVVAEKEPPYLVGCYELCTRAVECGRSLYRRDLARLSECLAQDRFPGLSDLIEPIDLPQWSYRYEY